VDPSPKDLTDQIDEATTLLLQDAEKLTDAQIRDSSLLAGWTRGYVLAHLTRTADALRGALDGRPATDGDRAGAEAGAAALTAEVRDSATALRAAIAAVPEDAWTSPVDLDGRPVPARQLLIIRLVEVELHHVDLKAGYRPSDWPVTFNELQLTDPQRQWRADRLV
jgi:maleylpyruvate isomerase